MGRRSNKLRWAKATPEQRRAEGQRLARARWAKHRPGSPPAPDQ